MAVEDDVVPIRENALDLAMRVRMIGLDRGDELAEPFHAVLDKRVVLAIDGSCIDPESVLNVAFKYQHLVEGHCVALLVSDMVLPFSADCVTSPSVGNPAAQERLAHPKGGTLIVIISMA